MSTTLRPPEQPPLWSNDRRPPDRGGGDPAPPAPRDQPPRRNRLVALLLTCALLGGAASTGVLALAGVLHGSGAQSTTTVLQSSAGTSSPGLDAGALYAAASPGVVDITSKGVSQSSGTGFVSDSDGHIVTAAHVVDGASSITVK